MFTNKIEMKYITKVCLEKANIAEAIQYKHTYIQIDNILKRRKTDEPLSQAVYTIELKNYPNITISIDGVDTFSFHKNQHLYKTYPKHQTSDLNFTAKKSRELSLLFKNMINI